MEEEERLKKPSPPSAPLPEKRAHVAMKFGGGKEKTPDPNGAAGAAGTKKAKPIVGKMPGR